MAWDHDEFRRLFEVEGTHVHRFLYRLVRHGADADDLLQETFLTAWRRRSGFDGRGLARGWLMAIGYRLWLDLVRKRQRRRGLTRAAPTRSECLPEPDHGRAEHDGRVAHEVRAALERLPEPLREVAVLFHVASLSTGEIAEVLDLEPKVVTSRIRRAMELLGRQLASLRRQLPIA